ncbi:MAG: tRNA 2-thiouridine(34) synthase MnmA [Neisseriales bacterium]|nr:MAG: tRNA 2-thiouridine(34) synthase MnmA [Neisseriales bacterium]
MQPKQRIVVGMSGGVDSSVTAWLLKKQGHEVVGVFMKNWEDEANNPYCSIKQDALDAIAVADVIGIDIHIVNFAKTYQEEVFADFLAEYAAGRTPNPDVFCNAKIKFKAFLDHAISLGAEAIATGHYANIAVQKQQYYLLKGVDDIKDQSYFLYRLNQYQLSHANFPLGMYRKNTVREIAQQANLPNAYKKDSTGICFIGERPFQTFLQNYLPHQPGVIMTLEGKIVGYHIGLMYYTIGQRKGLAIGGKGKPWYVIDKNIQKNQLIVAQGHNHPHLLKDHLTLTDVSWIAGKTPKLGRYQAKIRYQSVDATCFLEKNERFVLSFQKPQ